MRYTAKVNRCPPEVIDRSLDGPPNARSRHTPICQVLHQYLPNEVYSMSISSVEINYHAGKQKRSMTAVLKRKLRIHEFSLEPSVSDRSASRTNVPVSPHLIQLTAVNPGECEEDLVNLGKTIP